jgi:hypothetical protein
MHHMVANHAMRWDASLFGGVCLMGKIVIDAKGLRRMQWKCDINIPQKGGFVKQLGKESSRLVRMVDWLYYPTYEGTEKAYHEFLGPRPSDYS